MFDALVVESIATRIVYEIALGEVELSKEMTIRIVFNINYIALVFVSL